MTNISIENIRKKLQGDAEIRYRNLQTKKGTIHIVFDETLCDLKSISQFIIGPIQNKIESTSSIKELIDDVIASGSITRIESEEEVITHILSGDIVVIVPFFEGAFYCEEKAFAKRAPDIPPTETVIKGPREGFTETLSDNLAAIRRRLKTADLKSEHIVIGRKSKTEVVMLYIEGNCPEKLIDYVRTKIKDIEVDYILYSNLIEEKLKCKGTAFDTTGFTEKPDRAAKKLAEGRIIIMMNGTPFAIIVPFFFIENFHSTDDYTLNKFIAATGRALRWISFLSSTLLPGLYIALFTYHFNLIPYIFVFRMSQSRAGVPFPMIVEVMLMIFFFQVLREAGIRLPQPIGPTLSIVGALILGDAAVQSGLTSQVTVLIVALTSIAAFLVPTVSFAIFKWNIIILLFASFMGLPGFFMGFIVFVSHISSLTTCGYPYLYPIGTLARFNYKDIILRGDLDKINQNIFIKDDKK